MHYTQGKRSHILQAFLQAWGSYELNALPVYSLSLAPLLDYMKYHAIPIVVTREMNKDKLSKSLYQLVSGCIIKRESFCKGELSDQLHTCHVAIFPLVVSNCMKRLWISYLDTIPQAGRKSGLIYDFFYWPECTRKLVRLQICNKVSTGIPPPVGLHPKVGPITRPVLHQKNWLRWHLRTHFLPPAWHPLPSPFS